MSSSSSSSNSGSTQPSKLLGVLSPEVASYFIAGGCAGAASRTVVSPLERLKIIQQVQPKGSTQYKGVWKSLVRMWNEEGFRGYMRGNGINCLRIVPYSAVQFTTYEQLKKWFTSHGSKELDTPKRLASGALAGITSVCSTYPLDLVRARLSIATASIIVRSQQHGAPAGESPIPSAPNSKQATAPRLMNAMHTAATVGGKHYTASELTIWGMTLKIIREEGGIRGLYRGLVATAFGVAPYVGINFAAYEFLRGIITPPGKTTITRKLACGALAGSISQTLTYPFDVLRRKMQVTGMKSGDLGIKYTGAIDALVGIMRTEGITGLYRGLWPNLLKVAPSIATSFFTYELPRCCGKATQRRNMSSDNALPLPVSRRPRFQDLQAALAAPRPRSSSLAQAMGQGSSKPSTPQRGIASLASTGFKLKRAFAGRRKKSEDATTSFSSASSHSDRELDLSVGSSQPARAAAAVPPSEVTAPSSPAVSQQTKLTLKLVTQVLPTRSNNIKSAPLPPPPVPSKSDSMQNNKLSVPDTTASRNVDNRGSIIPISPGISSAVNFMRIGEEEREKERLEAQRTTDLGREKGAEKGADREADTRRVKDKGKQADVDSERKEERSKERPASNGNDDKLKQIWRKSDSTMSHHTIRPGAQVGNRSSRPVSMAESLQSNHTVVPVNKRLSALLTDAEFQMPEEDDSSFKSASEELVPPPPPVIAPVDFSSTSSPSATKSKRRSMSLNLGTFTQKSQLPPPPATSLSVGSATELQNASKSLPGPPAMPSTARETPSLTRAAANGIISPSSSGSQTTSNNIRGRLAPWSTTSRSTDGHGPNAIPPSRPTQTQHVPPSSFPRNTPHQPSGLRQTAISITGGLAPAAGLAKRAVEKMGRAWGGFSSHSNSSSHSGYSSSSSPSSSDHNLGRTSTNTAGSMGSLNNKGKSRRTPDAPSGAWSVASSTNSMSDTEGPSLGKKVRGPMRGLSPGQGGVVFGRRLDVVVSETAIGAGLSNHEAIKGHERLGSVDKDNLGALEHRLLPALVVRCAQHILVWGVHEEGLFRVNGRPSHVSRLRKEFDAGCDFDMKECSPGDLDPHAVASVFKAFLRELPEPILTNSLIPYFEAALSQENASNAEAQTSASPQKSVPRGPTLPAGPKAGFTGLRKPPSLSTLAMPNFSGMRPPSRNLRRALRSLLGQLPAENKDLIRTVTELIKATAKEHRETKMPLSNLLLVFCPSLNMNPPLLRVLCEAEGIWDGPPIESPVLDIKRESVFMDIKPESSSTSTNASIKDDDGDEDEQVFSDARDGPVEDSSSVTPSQSSEPFDPVLHRTGSKREAPRSRPMGPRRAGTTASNNDGFPSSPAASSISIATSESRSIPSPSDRGFVFSPPPLSSSAESLPTASSSSAAPSLADLQLKSETPDKKPLDLGSVQIADDLEHDLLNPRRFMVSNGPVEFPRTSGSTPTTPITTNHRRSILPLSLAGLGDAVSNSAPSSPAKRMKKPSLSLLFNKRSASSLTSSGTHNISSPCMTARSVSDSSISTPQTAMTARSTTFDLPPMLDTEIQNTPLKFGMGFDAPPTAKRVPEDEQKEPSKVEPVEEPIPRISAPTPPPGETPIAKMYSASSSTLSLSLNSNTESPQRFDSPNHPYASHLRSRPTRQQVMAKQSTTSLNHLMLLDDEEQEDWTQSVLIAAGAER
ncbi:hypothetical protein PQX77_000296 [Marasmius sp. AFHP31]|nr:hypothetical protein PQX77_000296 [Marasmius sp. AFHP31]